MGETVSVTKMGAKYHYLGSGEIRCFFHGGTPASRPVAAGVFIAFERGRTVITILPDESSAVADEAMVFEFAKSGRAYWTLVLDGDEVQRAEIGYVDKGGSFHLRWTHMLDLMA